MVWEVLLLLSLLLSLLVGGAVDGVGGVGGHGHCAGVLCIYVYMDRYRVYIYI